MLCESCLGCDHRSRSIFLSFTSGNFGAELIEEHLIQLNKFRFLGIHSIAKDFFKLSLEAMCENWKRLVLITESFPFTLFQLVECETNEQFLGLYRRLKSQQEKCSACADIEFSTVLLQFIDLAATAVDQNQQVESLKGMLNDLCIYAPLSSDLVECLHGYSQHLLHRWRGCKPTEPVAAERVLWTSITRAYSYLREHIWSRYGDKSAGHRLHKFGRTSNNQYSSKKAAEAESRGVCIPLHEDHCQTGDKAKDNNRTKPGKTMSFAKMDRLLAFDQEGSLPSLPAPRKLCGAWP